MKNDRLPWFTCDPTKLLGALAAMKPPKQLVYIIVLLRIYEAGGACPDSLDAIAMRTKHNKRVVSDALSELFSEGRLYRAADGIRNPKADAVVEDSIAILKRRKVASQKAGLASAAKRKQNQQMGATERQQTFNDFQHTNTNNNSKDSLPKGRAQAEKESVQELPLESVAMKDPPPDAEADYYRRGKEVLGHSSGGMLTKLLLAKGRNIALARAAIEQASTRGDAREYVGAMIRNGGTNERIAEGRTNGAYSASDSATTRSHTIVAAMGRTLERRRAERAADDARRQDIRGGSGGTGGRDA